RSGGTVLVLVRANHRNVRESHCYSKGKLGLEARISTQHPIQGGLEQCPSAALPNSRAVIRETEGNALSFDHLISTGPSVTLSGVEIEHRGPARIGWQTGRHNSIVRTDIRRRVVAVLRRRMHRDVPGQPAADGGTGHDVPLGRGLRR